MSATFILALLELMIQEAVTLAGKTKVGADLNIANALIDTYNRIKVDLAKNAGTPIDLSTIKDHID